MVSQSNEGPLHGSATILPLIPPQSTASLPLPLTNLVGRTQEVADVLCLLRDEHVRLVTLTGPGGIGKTRLAIAIATAWKEETGVDVAWTSLASVERSPEVLPAIAHALGLQRAPSGTLASLQLALGSTPLLLVLDNVEHLLDAASDLIQLLHLCPLITVLTTSRAALRVRGEHVYQIPPLAVDLPAEGDANPAGQMALRAGGMPAAVRLFAERAAEGSGFALDEMNASDVAAVCRRLDGVPLAIELAAARLSHLSLPALRARLVASLPLLTGGSRDLPDRHRTMRDAIAWSHELLPPHAQALFAALAIFEDGFSLEAVEHLASGLDDTAIVVDTLGTLVEHNLVRLEAAAPAAPRYHLLGMIREFAAEQLTARADEGELRSRHAAFMVVRAEHLALTPFLPVDERALVMLESERGNMRSALQFLDAASDSSALTRLVTALAWFWWTRGYWIEGRQWLVRVWDHAEASGRVEHLPAALPLSLGLIEGAGNGDLDRADQVLTTGLNIRRTTDDALGTTMLLIGLGWLANLRGRFQEAEALLSEAIDLTDRIGADIVRACLRGTVLANLGGLERMRGQLEAALLCHQEALSLHRQTGNTFGAFRNLIDLGYIDRDLGNVSAALRHCQEGLKLAAAAGDRRYAIAALEGIATSYCANAMVERGARVLGVAQRQRQAIGMNEIASIDRAARDRALAACRVALGDKGADAAMMAGSALDWNQGIAEALEPVEAPEKRVVMTLTAREREVLGLLVEGHTDRTIGEVLFIGTRTVESHVAHILEKLGVRTRAAAAATAVAAGLVDPPARRSDPPRAD